MHVTLNADHQYFYLKVEDSGIGIPEDSLEHIYERFFTAWTSHIQERSVEQVLDLRLPVMQC